MCFILVSIKVKQDSHFMNCEVDRTAKLVLCCAGKLPVRYWCYNRTEKVKTIEEYSTNERGEKYTKKVW
jgi:hypothetical protein